MRVGRFKFAAGKWIAGVALAAFALRTLIPAGFMLESGHPLTLIICPDGFPAALLADAADSMPDGGPGMPDGGHGMPHGSHSLSDHCLFTSGSSHGPMPLVAAPRSAVDAADEATAASEQLPLGVRLVHVPQARAPPSLA